MARELTEIEIKIVDGATKALESIKKSAAAGKTTFTELSSAIGLVENVLGKLASAGNFAVGLLDSAREAETAMQSVAVKTNATAEELEALRVKAKEVAFNLRTPFDQVAAGAAQLAADGANAAEVLANLETVTAFAGATSTKTADAAGQLSDILDGYGEKIANIGAIGDGIVATARAAGVGAAELAEGVKKLGPTARDANVDVTTITAALGVLAENGRGGGRAVKELETILIALKDPASTTGEVLKTLGLDAGNLGGVISRLSTDSDAARQVLETLGPKPALALKLLLSEGGGALKELTGIIQNSGGASKEAADKLGSTFDGAVTRIGIALDALKASFFTPLLKPLAEEIDFVSAKIQTFAGTKDFETLKGIVLDFVTSAITQVNRLGSEFDSTKAIAGIKQFVVEARIQFASLGQAAKDTKTVFDLFGIALNGAQSIGAELKGTFGEVGVTLGKITEKIIGATDAGDSFIDFFDGVAQSAANAAKVQELEFVAATESLAGVVGPATLELRKLQEAQLAQADAAQASAGATQQAAAATTEAAAAAEPASGAVLNVAKSLRVADFEAGKFGERVVSAVGAATPEIERLNKKLVSLQADLKKAFQSNDNAAFQSISAEIRTTTAELENLTGAAKPAADAEKKVGDEAQAAAPKVAALGDSSRATANDAKELSTATDSSASSFVGLAGSAEQAGTIIEDVSDKFVQLLRQQQQSGAAANLAVAEGLRGALEAQQRQVGLALAGLRDYQSEVEIRLKQLQSKFDLVGPDALRKLAEEQIADEKRRRDAAANTTPSVRNGGAGPGGAQGLAVTVNLYSLNPGDLSNTTVVDLARRLVKPIQTIISNGG